MWYGIGGTFSGDFTGGHFFTRIYQNNGSNGEYFMDIAMGDGANYIYNPSNTSTVFSDNVVPAGVNWVGSNGTQVVPEPATALLFGVGGIGAFIVRRNKKAKEEAEA